MSKIKVIKQKNKTTGATRFVKESVKGSRIFDKVIPTPTPLPVANSGLIIIKNTNGIILAWSGKQATIDLVNGGVLKHLGTPDQNLVNTYDLGRYNGASIYSNPEPYHINGKAEHISFVSASWNPVQAGDAGFNPSKVLESSWNATTGEYYAKTRPQQWKFTDSVPEPECLFETWYKPILGTTAIQVRQRVSLSRTGGQIHNGKALELPFGMFDRNLESLITYTGNAPFTGAATQSISYDYAAFGQPNTAAYVNGSEHWAALVRADGQGVGLVIPRILDGNGNVLQTGRTDFRANKYLNADGSQNPMMYLQSPDTYNDMGNNVIDKTYYWVLGTTEQIRAFAVSVH